MTTGRTRPAQAIRKTPRSEDATAAPPSSDRGVRRVRRKRVRRAGGGGPGRIVFGILLCLGAILAAAAIYLLVLYPSGAGPGGGKDVDLIFEHDEPASAVITKLDAAGLLRSPRAFALYARLVGLHVAQGSHLLTDDASPHELVLRLEREGHASHAKVTIPEGWNRFDIAKRLQTLHVTWSAAFLDATANTDLLRELSVDGDNAEGFLFPATYDLPLDSDPKEIVRRLVGEFDKRYLQIEQNHRLGLQQLESKLGPSSRSGTTGRREIVTLASMVEKEAAVDDERPIIASVFLNRLTDPTFKRKVLQCDPTSGYGCLALKEKVPACAGFAGKVTHAINTDPMNAYSTYIHEGLPPGPIANPGIKSLQAVLAPASTKFLYFVVRGDRRHAFSETLEEHNNAVKDLRDRSGKDTKDHP